MRNEFHIALFVFTFFFSAEAYCQPFWTQLPTPSGGAINCLHQCGDMIFTGTDGGLFRSSDSGRTWQQMPLLPVKVTSLASGGANVLLAGGERGVFISSDFGESWAHTTLTILVAAVAVTADGWLFAGTGDTGDRAAVYRSTDHGANWHKLSPIAPLLDTRFKEILIADDGSILAGMEESVPEGPKSRLLRSADNGACRIPFE